MSTPTSYPSASLYVGDLHVEVNEALLYEVFKEIGPIVSIRVCRDAMTRKSLGYAYVNFQNGADAEKAMDSLNFTVMHERPIRIMWSQRDPSLRRSGVGNIFVKNLDAGVHTKDLLEIFKRYGRILSCKVSYTLNKDNERISNGYGFVHFETQEAADKAIKKTNGIKINGKPIFVGNFIKQSERPSKAKDEVFTNVYIKNLPKDVDDEKLEDIFKKYGAVQNAAVMKDKDGNSKGFGFVNFVEHEDAQNAINELDGKPTGFEDQTYTVCRAQTRDERKQMLSDKFEKLRVEEQRKRQGTNLYVRNLQDDVDDVQLREIFQKFGEIQSVRVMRDPKKQVSRGFGFVCFKNAEDAQKAITEMNNKMMNNKPLFVALQQKKQFRQKQMEAHLRNRGSHVQPPMMRGAPPNAYMYPHPGFQAYPPMGYPSPPMAQPAWPHQAKQFQNRTRGGPKNGRNGPQQLPQEAQQIPFSSYLAQLTPEEQKQQIGNRLYAIVLQHTNSHLAGKITGMLLEMEVTDLLDVLENPQALSTKINEANHVLHQHQTQQQAQE